MLPSFIRPNSHLPCPLWRFWGCSVLGMKWCSRKPWASGWVGRADSSVVDAFTPSECRLALASGLKDVGWSRAPFAQRCPPAQGKRAACCGYQHSDEMRCRLIPAAPRQANHPAQPNRNKVINSNLLFKKRRLSRNSAIDRGGLTPVSARFLCPSHNKV